MYVVNVLYCDLLCLSQLPVGKPHGQIIQTAYAADGRRVLLISPHPAKIAKTTYSTVQSESAVSHSQIKSEPQLVTATKETVPSLQDTQKEIQEALSIPTASPEQKGKYSIIY